MNIRSRSRLLASLVFAAFLSTTLHLAAQQPSQPAAAVATLPSYDVVSIRKSKSDVSFGRPLQDGLIETSVPLTYLLILAYGIGENFTTGLPGWAHSTRFDINARISDPDINALKKLSLQQRRAMMIALLNDRFHLRAHIETKMLPVYDLVVAKGGPRLKDNPTPPGPDAPGVGPHNMKPGSMMMGKSDLTAVGVPISGLAANLGSHVQRKVIDKTGLTGKYDFTLKWRPNELEGKADVSPDDNNPDLFTALQEQLGLKLVPSRGPVDTLVIDHVEMPAKN